jgi:hypothetical protein
MAITLLTGVAAGPFTVSLARRVRGAVIAAYGPATGLVLGIVSSLLWLRSFSFRCVPGQRLGQAGIESYLVIIISSLVLSLALSVAAFLSLPAAGVLARRLDRTYATGFFIAYLLLTGALLAIGISLEFGWFGDASITTAECLEDILATP